MLSRSAHLHRVLLRRVQQAPEREGVLVGAPRLAFGSGCSWLVVDTPVSLQSRGLGERVSGMLVLLDREQHLLPVLQAVHLPGIGGL